MISQHYVYFCTSLVAFFASITAGLSLEELSLQMQQMARNNEELHLKIRHLEENNKILMLQQKKNSEEFRSEVQRLKKNAVAKDDRLQELELKVQHLEFKLKKQDKDFQKLSSVQSAVQESAYMILGKQKDQRIAMFRTCRELHQADPSLDSGMYWIDPDGQGVGDNPIYVQCDMSTGKTSVLHDSEDPTNVGHCADPGCYSKLINYSATMRQMNALAELSSECHQSIRYDCNFAPLETGGVPQSWWNDKHGVAQYFWSGSNNSIHTCQCGIDKNCVEPYFLCNCDSGVPVLLNDNGVITDKSYLPITRLYFGRTQLASSSGVHTLGRFECSGQISVTGMPTSCSDLWKIGHTLSGIYSVMGSNYVETVYCDFAKLSYEQGFQTPIGYADVKSTLIHFYVQKNQSYSVQGSKIPFELTRLNIGGAMNASSGIFTAPRNGIYSFHFSCITDHPTTSTYIDVFISLMLNGVIIGSSEAESNYERPLYTQSLHSTLELKMGDQVWITIKASNGGLGILYEDVDYHFTHFTGYLLQENVANSLKLVNGYSL